MKSIKLLGLAAITALAAMAFVGAGSASATILCEVNVGESVCPREVALPTTMLGYAAPVQFSVSNYKMSCGSSQMKLKAEKSLGAGKGISGQLSSLSFKSCASWAGECSAPEVRNLPYKAELHETAGGNTLTLSSGGAGNPTLRFESCHLQPWEPGATCTYSAEKLELGFNGVTSPKTITASNEHLELQKPNKCYTPQSLDISGSYGVQDLDFPATSGEIALKNSSSETKYSCAGSAMSGSMDGTISSLTFSGCSGWSCTTAKALNTPYLTSYSPSGAESGTMNVYGFKLEISCMLGVKCIYTPSGGPLTLDVEGFKIIASNEPLIEGKSCEFLPISASLNGTYVKGGTILALAANP